MIGTGTLLIRAGLVGYALCAPFSLSAATVMFLMALAGGALNWVAGEWPSTESSVGWAILAYLAVKLVTGGLAYDARMGMREFFHLWPWLLVWVMPYAVRTGPARVTLYRIFAVSCGLASLYAVVQNLTGIDVWRDSHLPDVMGRYPAVGFFDNQQTWAGFALVASLYLAGVAMESARQRLLFAAGSVLSLLGAVASQIRGTLIGLAAGVAVWVVHSRRGVQTALWFVAAACVALWLSPGTLIRFNELKDRSLNPAVDISRPYIWTTAWTMGAQRPLLGVGPGNFETVYETTKPDAWARTMGHAHNEWFQEWATSGLPGVLAFTWLLFVVTRALWQRRRTGGLPALAAWVGLSASALLQCQFGDDEVLMAALFVACLGLRSEPDAADNTKEGRAA